MSALRYVVPDTCALAATLYNEAHSSNADPLLEAIRSGTVEAVAPTCGLTEFLNLSRRKHEPDRSGSVLLTAQDVEAVVFDFLTLPIFWVETTPMLALEAWQWHQNHGLQTGDAFFLEVARQWQAEIWTTDSQFVAVVKPIHPAIFDLKTIIFS